MSKNNSKSLSTLRQKLRKYSKDFDDEITKFRENPDQGDEDEDEGEREESSDSESEAETGPASFKKSTSEPSAESKLPKTTSQDDDGGSDDSIDWGTDSESDSDSSEDDAQYTNIRERFLKR